MPFRVLLPYRHTSCVSGGDLLPARGSLGPDALSAGRVQRNGRTGGVHLLPARVHMPRLRPHRPYAMSVRDGVQPDNSNLAQSAMPAG